MPNTSKPIPAITADVMKEIGDKEKEIMTLRKELILSILKEKPELSPKDAAIMVDGVEASNKGWVGCC